MISINNLQKISGGKTALKVPSLQVTPGEECALVRLEGDTGKNRDQAAGV